MYFQAYFVMYLFMLMVKSSVPIVLSWLQIQISFWIFSVRPKTKPILFLLVCPSVDFPSFLIFVTRTHLHSNHQMLRKFTELLLYSIFRTFLQHAKKVRQVKLRPSVPVRPSGELWSYEGRTEYNWAIKGNYFFGWKIFGLNGFKPRIRN